MRYEFEDVETGELVEVEMHPDKAVPFGETIRWGGRKLKRLVHAPAIKMGYSGGSTVQVPRFHPDAPRHDAKGNPVFANARERSEFVDRYNARGTHQVLDVE